MDKYQPYFEDKIILITGGGSGLGRELAFFFADQGGLIFILDVDRQSGAETVKEITERKGAAFLFVTDVTNHSVFLETVNRIYSMYGRVDILINNAGVNITGEVRDLTIDHWKRTIDLNLTGVANGVSIIYPRMVNQRSGQIVNIASMAGLAPLPLVAPYVASKFGVIGLSEALRIEARDFGIRINMVCPGRLATRIMEDSDVVNADRERFMKKVPFKAFPLRRTVRIIATGMIKNKKMIVFPWYVRLMWLVYRIVPGFLNPFYRHSINQFRKIRY